MCTLTSNDAGKPMLAITQSRGTISQHHLDRRPRTYYSKLQELLQMFVQRWEQTNLDSALSQGIPYTPWD